MQSEFDQYEMKKNSPSPAPLYKQPLHPVLYAHHDNAAVSSLARTWFCSPR